MALPDIKRPVTSSYKWLLLLLLLALLALMFLYKKEDGRTYGEDMLVEMQRLTTKAIRKGGEIIRSGNVVKGCVTKECLERKSAVAAKPAAAKDGVAPRTTVATAEGEKAASLPASVPDGASAPVQEGAAPNYPAYPAYPAYPPYADYSSQGGQTGMPGTGAPANAEQQVPPGDASQASQRNFAPSAPPTPQAVAGGPSYPAYPSYPSYPAYSQMPQSNADAQMPQVEQPRIAPAPVAETKSPELAKEVVKARRAAMQKRYRDAIQEYKKHLASRPDDMDGYGELGNVYLLAQQYPQAARNYYEAATRLVDGGFVETATPLLPIISQYEPMLAMLIKQKAARLNDR